MMSNLGIEKGGSFALLLLSLELLLLEGLLFGVVLQVLLHF